MAHRRLASFSIKGLFGFYDVHIPFDGDVKILVGENGLGKTQVLNLFYYALTQDFARLAELEFNSLALVFLSGEAVEVKKAQVVDLHEWSQSEQLDSSRSKFLTKEARNTQVLRESDLAEFYYRVSGRKKQLHAKYMSPTQLAGALDKSGLAKAATTIGDALQGIKILYFPTFRRVEEDLYNRSAFLKARTTLDIQGQI